MIALDGVEGAVAPSSLLGGVGSLLAAGPSVSLVPLPAPVAFARPLPVPEGSSVSWLSEAVGGVGSLVGKIAGPVSVGALAIPGVGPMVSTAVQAAGALLGASQSGAQTAAAVTGSLPGDFAQSYLSARMAAPVGRTTTLGAISNSFQQALSGGGLPVPLWVLAAAGGGVLWLVLSRRGGRRRSYGRGY